MIAHVGALPVEELLPLAAAGPLLWPAVRALVRKPRVQVNSLAGADVARPPRRTG